MFRKVIAPRHIKCREMMPNNGVSIVLPMDMLRNLSPEFFL